MTWQFTLTGLLIGSIVGLTGMGGGSLMTPILVIVFGFKPTYAVGTDIVHGAIFKSFGAARHRQLGNVHVPLGKVSFEHDKLDANFRAVLDEVQRAKPAAAKGRYIKKITISSTMGPGVRVDTNRLKPDAE